MNSKNNNIADLCRTINEFKMDSNVEIAIAKLKRYKSSGNDQIPTELIQAGRETLRSEIHKLIHSV
jgi:hypothetical protein